MLVVLGLIDVVMISNLLIMVIIGGYETFVSRLRPAGPSRPAGMAQPRQCQRAQDQAGHGDHRHLVDPSAADLHRGRQYRQHRPPTDYTVTGVILQTMIHVVFILSAIGIAWVDRMTAHRRQGPLSRNREPGRWAQALRPRGIARGTRLRQAPAQSRGRASAAPACAARGNRHGRREPALLDIAEQPPRPARRMAAIDAAPARHRSGRARLRSRCAR